jgi:hypothetical protein
MRTSQNSVRRKFNFSKSTYPDARPTDDPRSQRSSLPRRSSKRSRRSSMRAKCSLILCLNSCSGIASPGSLGSPERSSKSPPRSRLCRSRSRPLRPCPPPLACLSLSLPTWPSSLFSTSLVAISFGKVCTRKRAKVASDTSTTAENSVKTKLAERSSYALKWMPLSCHFLSYSILRKSPVPRRRGRSIHAIYVGRALPAVDSFLRVPMGACAAQPDACLVTYRELLK